MDLEVREMPKAIITITFKDDGSVDVHGPIEDKILCFGLLRIAEFVIKEYEPTKVVIPNFIPPKDLKGKGN